MWTPHLVDRDSGQWNIEDRSLLSCSIYSYLYGNNILTLPSTLTTCLSHEFTNVDTSLMQTLRQSPNGVHISEVLLYVHTRIGCTGFRDSFTFYPLP